MRLGLTLSPLSNHGPDPAALTALAQSAEANGLDSVWIGEAYGSDAATVLAWLAAGTSRIGLGSAVLQLPGRSAAMTAMTAATLDRLSGGRVRVGLGASNALVSETWHGVDHARPLTRMREYVATVRQVLARERVGGGPLRLTIAPVQERVPILLAGLGPRAIALAGEIGDGWLGMFVVPEHFGAARAALEQGGARAGRALGEAFDVSPCVPLCLDDDLAGARDAVRPHVALYVGAMGAPGANPYNAAAAGYGFADAARTVQEHYLAGRRDEAIAAVPDALVDLLALVGPADRVRDRLDAFRAIGTGTLQLMPFEHARPAAEQLAVVADLL